MGPLLLQKYPADGQKSAQCFYQEMLPICLHGPIIAAEKCYRYHWMGPLLLLNNSSNEHACAQCFYEEKLPIPLNGLIVAFTNISDRHEWAQHFYQNMLPMPLDGPIIATEEYPGGHEWALCFSKDMLPMPLNGPHITAESSCQWMATNGPSVPTKKCSIEHILHQQQWVRTSILGAFLGRDNQTVHEYR